MLVIVSSTANFVIQSYYGLRVAMILLTDPITGHLIRHRAPLAMRFLLRVDLFLPYFCRTSHPCRLLPDQMRPGI